MKAENALRSGVLFTLFTTAIATSCGGSSEGGPMPHPTPATGNQAGTTYYESPGGMGGYEPYPRDGAPSGGADGSGWGWGDGAGIVMGGGPDGGPWDTAGFGGVGGFPGGAGSGGTIPFYPDCVGCLDYYCGTAVLNCVQYPACTTYLSCLRSCNGLPCDSACPSPCEGASEPSCVLTQCNNTLCGQYCGQR